MHTFVPDERANVAEAKCFTSAGLAISPVPLWAATERDEAVVRDPDLRGVEAKPAELCRHGGRRGDKQIDLFEDPSGGRQSRVDIPSRERQNGETACGAPNQSGEPGEPTRRRHRCASDRPRGTRGGCQPANGDVSVHIRLRKAARAPLRVDDLTQVALGSMDPLAARRAHQCVVVQGGDHRDTEGARDGRQIEGEVEQIVDVDDIWLHRSQDMRDATADERRPVGLLE